MTLKVVFLDKNEFFFREDEMLKMDKKRTRRILEWCRCGVFPGQEIGCIISGCEAVGSECRETSEGVLCLEHYMALPECEEIIEVDGKLCKCGKPAIQGVKNGREKVAGTGHKILCREHYCGPIDDEYLARDRYYWSGVKNVLGPVQDTEGFDGGEVAEIKRGIKNGSALAMRGRRQVYGHEGEWNFYNGSREKSKNS